MIDDAGKEHSDLLILFLENLQRVNPPLEYTSNCILMAWYSSMCTHTISPEFPTNEILTICWTSQQKRMFKNINAVRVIF